MNNSAGSEDCRIAVTFGMHPPLRYRADRLAAQRFLHDFARRIHDSSARIEDGPPEGLPRLPCERFWLPS